jgi:hypothetical protein
MTEDERAALVEQIAKAICTADEQNGGLPWEGLKELRPRQLEPYLDRAKAALAAIEPAIRADERARVVAEATTDEAAVRAIETFWDSTSSSNTDSMREAIRAALGDGL